MIVYDQTLHGYRQNGTPVTETTILEHIDIFNAELSARLRRITESFRRGKMTAAAYRTESRRIIKEAHLLSYIVGHGGRASMTLSDWGRVGYYLRSQYAYFANFMSEMDSLTVPEAQARADYYIDASHASYYRGRAAGVGISLPAYPGDGTTLCRTGCKCGWTFQFNEDGSVYAYWNLGVAEHCADCVARSQLWSPYVAN